LNCIGQYSDIFKLPVIRNRELFAAFNVDTHPAHLFRGKCQVKELSEISDIASAFLEQEDNFFHQHGYKPESRRMTKMDEFSFIPYSQQAVLPQYLKEPAITADQISQNTSDKIDRYNMPEERITGPELLVWKPQIDDESLLMYLRAAR
jgi:hypothetical protein